MTAVADAKPCITTDWKQYNWDQAKQNVQRLQTRIVKAWKSGKYKTAKNLQRLLVRSLSARMIAVRQVTTNHGKETPGIDGVIWKYPDEKEKAAKGLSSKGYSPQPLRRVYIPKRNGKKRPLGIPTMKDRAMQALYAAALDPIAEVKGDKFSYGFRRTRSTYDANTRSHRILCRKGSPQWIFEADIEGCFDNISHAWLIKNIPMDKKILHKWLKAGYLDKNVFRSTLKGTPQGGIISPILANMTLDGLQAAIASKVGKAGSWRGNHNKFHLNRFADDFYFTAVNRSLLENEVIPTVKKFLIDRGLKLSEEKSRITHINNGFVFLGQTIQKRKDKLLITPSKGSIKRIKSKMKGIVKQAWWCTAEQDPCKVVT